jgi:oligosaccharide repeat unit polymerase
MFLHPLVIFSIVWLGVISLYSLHLSKLLIYSTPVVTKLVLVIWVPFATVILVSIFFRRILISIRSSLHKLPTINIAALERKLIFWFRVWMTATFLEIIVSGGLPLLWLVQHSSKTYKDFGISSLHGLVNSLLLSIALCRFLLFLLTRSRRHLVVPIFTLGWFILVVTRNQLLVALIEFAVLFFRIRPIKKTVIVKFIVGIVCFILAFGAIGDYRTGSSDLIRLWAQPTDQYPDWLPSGVLWAYIYISTPINNLVHTSEMVRPVNNLAFPNTVVNLFPTVVRKFVYGEETSEAESGELVASTFNVSTAYIGPVQDYGFVGIALFSMVIAAFCQFFWVRSSLRDILIYCVLAQCLILSLFFNHFLLLPIIFQTVWICFFLGQSNHFMRRLMGLLFLPIKAQNHYSPSFQSFKAHSSPRG